MPRLAMQHSPIHTALVNSSALQTPIHEQEAAFSVSAGSTNIREKHNLFESKLREGELNGTEGRFSGTNNSKHKQCVILSQTEVK
jgi:hypothetical protein